jgi:hypothetical protein
MVVGDGFVARGIGKNASVAVNRQKCALVSTTVAAVQVWRIRFPVNLALKFEEQAARAALAQSTIAGGYDEADCGCGDGDGGADRAKFGGRSWRAELYQGGACAGAGQQLEWLLCRWHLGYGWGNGKTDVSFLPSPADFGINNTTLGVRSTGVVGGAQAGYNWQMGTLVTGLEADIQGSSIKGSVRAAATLVSTGCRIPTQASTPMAILNAAIAA